METLRCTVTDLMRRPEDILGQVRHAGRTYAVTRRGRVVAMLTPPPQEVLTKDPAVAAVDRHEKTH
jgi:antitoxin (DNA-binding transcriptional repressor) of toxin-antitoxin stability system